MNNFFIHYELFPTQDLFGISYFVIMNANPYGPYYQFDNEMILVKCKLADKNIAH